MENVSNVKERADRALASVSEEKRMASVVMLTYNHVKYVEKAITSILEQQTTFSFELIIGDDASTDGTLEIVNQFQERFPDIIRVIQHEENVGASRNSYDCLRSCKGEYIASCEGDDYWTDSQKLQTQVMFLEEHPEFIGCYHPIKFVDENDKPIRKYLYWASDKEVFSLKDFKGIFLPGQIVSLVRRNLFLDPEYNPTIIFEADRQIADRTNILLLLAKGDIYRLPNVMAAYRSASAGTNLTNQIYKQHIDGVLRDYQYTKRLEEYAKSVLEVSCDFEYHKKELFAKSVFRQLLHPRDYTLETAKQILDDAPSAASYILSTVPFAIRFLFRKIKK